jgi:hypothetical protein
MQVVLTCAICVVLVTLNTGCAHPVATFLPDGQKGYAISCRGFTRDWKGCLVTAGHLCGSNGYEVAYSDEFQRELIVSCKGEHATGVTFAPGGARISQNEN